MMKYILLLLLISNVVFSQEGTLIGTVTDTNDEPLVGATVIYKGDFTRGATADLEGNYTLKLPVGEQRIVCRSSDMVTDTILVTIKEDALTEQNIQLKYYASEVQQFDAVNIKVGKFDKKIEDITVSLEIIKPEMLENKNTRSIETALDQTPGLNILDGEPQIRGGSGFTFGVGSKVAVIVDDMPMLSGDAGKPEWSFIPVENIKQIEVVKGASSVLSGSSALSGAIHIRTAYPMAKPKTKVNLYTGMYSEPSGENQTWWTELPIISGANVLHSRKIKQWDVVLGANVNYDKGYIGPPVTDEFIEDTISNFNNRDMVATRGRFNFNLRRKSKKFRGLSYGLNGNFMKSQSVLAFAWLNDSTGLYQGYPGAVFLQDQTIFNLDPFIHLKLESGSKHKLRGRVLRTVNDITGNQSNEATVTYADYQFLKSYTLLNGFDFIGGISFLNTNSFAQLYAGSGSPNNRILNLSGYTQIEKKIKDVLNVSLGGRLEYFQLNDTVTAIKPIFRAGASLKVHQETYVRMSYGQGYRFPTITERFIKTGIGNFGVFPNPELKPESSWNAEVGIKQGIKLGKIYGYLDVAGFWQEYENTIEYLFGFWDVDSPFGAGFKFLNTGRSRVLGIDVSLSGQAIPTKNIKINYILGYNYIMPKTLNPDLVYAVDEHPVQPREYSYNSTSLDSTRNILKYRFLHNIKADVECVLFDKIAIGGSAKYFSKLENLDNVIAEFEEATNVINTIQNIRYMDYYNAHRFGNWVFDARVSYQITEQHKIAVVGTNIFNRSYSLRPLKIEQPRTIMFQYTLKLDKN